MELNILYEDNHIIVCVKPSGVLSQGGDLSKPNMVDLLKKYLKETYSKPGNVYLGLVHRLDLNVGGVMVFAKTSKAAKRLSEQVRAHEFGKQYLAIVSGHFPKQMDQYSDYLIKDQATRQALVTSQSLGKLAKLSFQVLDYDALNNQSLVLIDLITGRFHQIRAQFAYHPKDKHFQAFNAINQLPGGSI